MTIDESIENLVLIKKLEDSLGYISGYTNSVASQSLGCAMDTMRKYQKIVQIIENVDKRYYGYSTMMDYLHEVVGNDNK